MLKGLFGGLMALGNLALPSYLWAETADFPCRVEEFQKADAGAEAAIGSLLPLAEGEETLDFLRGKSWAKTCDSRQIQRFKVVGAFLLQQDVDYRERDCSDDPEHDDAESYYVYTWSSHFAPEGLEDYTVVKLKLYGYCSPFAASAGQSTGFLGTSSVSRDFNVHQAFRLEEDGHLSQVSWRYEDFPGSERDRVDYFSE